MGRSVLNSVLVVIGFICVGIGAVGVVLPILPTTPFLLVALACFAKGSERFHTWFMGTGLYKNHLEDFAVSRSMKLKTKAMILIPVTLLLMIPFITVNVLPMRIFILCLIAIKYYYFIFRIKTI